MSESIINYTSIYLCILEGLSKYITKMKPICKKIFDYVYVYNDLYYDMFLSSEPHIHDENLLSKLDLYEFIPNDVIEKLVFHRPSILESMKIVVTKKMIENMDSSYEFKNLENRINEFNPDMQKFILSKDASMLRGIKNQTEELCMTALDNNRYFFEYIQQKYITDKVGIHAIKLDIKNFKHIVNPSEKICIEAVKLNPSYLSMIRHQSDDICIAALEKDINCYKYIKFPSNKVNEYYKNKSNKYSIIYMLPYIYIGSLLYNRYVKLTRNYI